MAKETDNKTVIIIILVILLLFSLMYNAMNYLTEDTLKICEDTIDTYEGIQELNKEINQKLCDNYVAAANLTNICVDLFNAVTPEEADKLNKIEIFDCKSLIPD